MNNHVQKIFRAEGWWAVVFLAPCLLGLLIFTYLPIAASFGLSFSYWNLLGTPHWVGLENYQHVLADPLFWKTLLNTGLFVVGVALLEIWLGLVLAVTLNQIWLGKTFFRTAYFLPFVTPLVSVAVVWGWIYEPEYGLLNWGLSFAPILTQWNGGEPIAWLYDPRTALWALVLLSVWKSLGYTLVLFLAGLQAIPNTVYESASLDGAGTWQTFWKVTLPMVTPTLFFVSIITLINGFQAFDAVYLLTQGGPQHSTTVLVYWMFKNAFEFYKIGPASAIAYLLFFIVLLLTLVQWQLRKRWVMHEGDV
ncbi:MAG: sugar ABC transporter permease [Vampirovibrio sp.]|nr:sugar ABC transporter permease [Vampirovibrio sp.]